MDRHRIYIGSSTQELSCIETDAWQRGFECARRASTDVLGDIVQADAAEIEDFDADVDALELVAGECTQALRSYAPLDHFAFTETFRRGWLAGYNAGSSADAVHFVQESALTTLPS